MYKSFFISESRLRKIITEAINRFELHDLLSSCDWRDIDFIEGDIEESGCERLIVTVKGIKVPIDIINLVAQQTRIGKIQLHTFIDNDFQGLGIGTKVYNSFIHQFGGIYSGFRRVMNQEAIMSIYKKLQSEPDIDVHYVLGYEREPIGIEAVLKQKEQTV